MLPTAVAERLADVRPLCAKAPDAVDEAASHVPSAMLVSVGGKATDVSDVQLLKVASGMVVICVDERSIDVSPDCMNVLVVMAVSVVGNSTDVNELQR